MTKSLVIVESPAKAKTIKRYLGKDFNVKASVGHFRDLPKKGLGVDVENQPMRFLQVKTKLSKNLSPQHEV